MRLKGKVKRMGSVYDSMVVNGRSTDSHGRVLFGIRLSTGKIIIRVSASTHRLICIHVTIAIGQRCFRSKYVDTNMVKNSLQRLIVELNKKACQDYSVV